MTAKIQTDLNSADFDGLTQDEKPYYFYDVPENFLTLKRLDIPTKEHSNLIHYLLDVLTWYYYYQICTVYTEFNFYQTDKPDEVPFYPDLAVIKGFKHPQGISSYRLGVTGPAPNVTIEIISKNTRSVDLERKPAHYAAWGVPEYFVYDPCPRQHRSKSPRLWGWRIVEGQYQLLQPDEAGRLWSEELDSWLGPDNEFMRLYDRAGNRRLTKAEFLEAKLRELGYDPDKL